MDLHYFKSASIDTQGYWGMYIVNDINLKAMKVVTALLLMVFMVCFGFFGYMMHDQYMGTQLKLSSSPNIGASLTPIAKFAAGFMFTMCGVCICLVLYANSEPSSERR